MGSGCYSYISDCSRKVSNSTKSREEVFSQKRMSSDMDIRNKVRECLDSEEHPETLALYRQLCEKVQHVLESRDYSYGCH